MGVIYVICHRSSVQVTCATPLARPPPVSAARAISLKQQSHLILIQLNLFSHLSQFGQAHIVYRRSSIQECSRYIVGTPIYHRTRRLSLALPRSPVQHPSVAGTPIPLLGITKKREIGRYHHL